MINKMWATEWHRGSRHVLPLDDVRSHLHSFRCPCGPELQAYEQPDGWNWIWVIDHNSFDGRENTP